MTPWPTEQLAAWRTARRYCTAACFAYHATWPLCRGLGIKASPAWHTSFYRSGLAKRKQIGSPQQMNVLIAGAADVTLPALLVKLFDSTELHLHVIDRCPSPITRIRQARTIAQAANLTTEVITVQDLTAKADFDLIVTDGLLSLQPDPASRHHLLDQFAVALRPDGALLYTTRTTPHPALPFDRAGRIIQAAATFGWPHPEPTRRQVTTGSWARPARSAAYNNADELATDLRACFNDVTVTTCQRPPTLPLRLHPHTSHIIRAIAAQPITRPQP